MLRVTQKLYLRFSTKDKQTNKKIQGKWVLLGSKTACLHNSGSALKIFLKILNNESGQEINENFIYLFIYLFYFIRV